MDKSNLPTIILIIIIVALAFYVFSADTIFAKEDDKYNVEILTVLTTAYDPFNTQALFGVYSASKNESVNAVFTLVDIKGDSDKYFSEAVNRKNNLICSVGYSLIDAQYNSAVENPETDYLTVDMVYTEDKLPKNMANIVFRSNEASYVAGYAAGMTTKTNIIGFIGGMDTSIIRGFYYGFLAGVNRAENDRGVKITVLDEYVGDYNNPYTANDMADEMYDSNVDIIFSVAGASGNGIISSAIDNNKYVIGVDVDQNYMAPENVIFSVIKKIDTSVCAAILDYAGGINHGGKVISLGYAENGVDVVSYLSVVDKKTIAEADRIEEDIISGKIIVPNTAEEYYLFNR